MKDSQTHLSAVAEVSKPALRQLWPALSSLAAFILLTAMLNGCSSGPGWEHQAFSFTVPSESPASATNSQPAQTNLVSLSRVSVSPLFQSRAFTYRTADNTYKHDPYAGFLAPPDRALAESIRGWLRAGGAMGRVLEPGGALAPTLIVEASVNELYGDFRNPSQPLGTMEIHVIVYEGKEDGPGRIVLDKIVSRQTALARKTPAALAAAWDADLREIMKEINSEYAKANPDVR